MFMRGGGGVLIYLGKKRTFAAYWTKMQQKLQQRSRKKVQKLTVSIQLNNAKKERSPNLDQKIAK